MTSSLVIATMLLHPLPPWIILLSKAGANLAGAFSLDSLVLKTTGWNTTSASLPKAVFVFFFFFLLLKPILALADVISLRQDSRRLSGSHKPDVVEGTNRFAHNNELLLSFFFLLYFFFFFFFFLHAFQSRGISSLKVTGDLEFGIETAETTWRCKLGLPEILLSRVAK